MDIMYDLETLGTQPDAAILEIGAVAFQPNMLYTPEQIDQLPHFVKKISPFDQKRRIDPGTVKWWASQEQAVFQQSMGGTIPISNVLNDFRGWCMSQSPKIMWCWGATFDHVLLTHALNQLGIPTWGNFRDWLCARTVNHLLPIKKENNGRWTSHSALSDARSQTYALCQSLTKLTGR